MLAPRGGGYDDYPELYTRWFQYATFLPIFRTRWQPAGKRSLVLRQPGRADSGAELQVVQKALEVGAEHRIWKFL